MKAITTPDRLEFERQLRSRGVRWLAGVDEAGRGPLAGPVVVAAVMLPAAWIKAGLPAELAELNDSKQLTETQREQCFAALTRRPEVLHAIVSVEAGEVDRLNILRATHAGFARALALLQPTPEHVLVDGLPVPNFAWAQTALVKGDARSYSIAAASVLAKVTRDRAMRCFDQQYPAYGFAQHKGYPTPAHFEALRRHGPSPIHRRSFAPVRDVQSELPLSP
jgi:ribonuclease HII